MPDQAQAHALAPDGQAVDGRVDQLGGLGRAALPASQGQRAVGRQVVPGRLGDGRGLLDERGSRPELAGVQVRADPLGQGEREHAQRADVAGQLEMPSGQCVPALVIPQIVGGMAGHEEPAELVLEGQVTTPERSHGGLQGRRPGLIPVGDQDGQSVQQQVRRARLRRGRRAERGPGHLGQVGPAGQAPDEYGRRQRVQVGLAGQPDVKRPQLPGRVKINAKHLVGNPNTGESPDEDHYWQ